MSRGFAALVLAVTICVGVSDGSPATGTPGGVPTAGLAELEGEQPGQQPQLFGATVSRVRVDVIVTDAEGNFVDDLTAEDFEVFEDGERQQILDVQLVDLGTGRVRSLFGEAAPIDPTTDPADPAANPANPAADPATAGIGSEGSASNPASALGAVIFLIDGPSLDQQAKARFGDAWSDLLEQTEALRVPRAAYLFNNYGRIEELAPLDTDLETIRAAADRVREMPAFGTSMRNRMVEIASDMTDTTIAPTPDIARQIAAAKARGFEVEEQNRSLATYELLTNLADAMWARSGRTAVVWVSTGIKLMQGGPYTALVAFDPRLTSVPEGDPAAVDIGLAGARFELNSPDARILAAQERLHRAANASNVSFYTIDPSLLAETRRVGTDIQVRTGSAAEMLSTPAVESSLDGLRDSMRSAADETGGRAFIQDTDIAMALEEIESDTSRFYLITYSPPDSRGDGSYHEIDVELPRDDLVVRARAGYVDYPADDRARRSVEVAIALPGLANDLPTFAEVFRTRPPEGGPNLLTAVAIDGGEIGVAVGPAGERRVSLDVHAVVLSEDGIVDESHQQLGANSGPDGNMLASPGGSLRPTLVGFMAYQREWTLDPGQYTLNIAVLDNISGRVGGSSIDVEIVPSDGGWGISDPILATADDAGRIQPVVLGRVLEGQGISAFVEAYGGVQPVLSGQVFLRPEDGGNPDQGAQLFSTAMRPAGPGMHRGSLLLPPGMPPGRYIVQLQITDEPARQSQIVRTPLEVVGAPRR